MAADQRLIFFYFFVVIFFGQNEEAKMTDRLQLHEPVYKKRKKTKRCKGALEWLSTAKFDEFEGEAQHRSDKEGDKSWMAVRAAAEAFVQVFLRRRAGILFSSLLVLPF